MYSTHSDFQLEKLDNSNDGFQFQIHVELPLKRAHSFS